MRSHLMPPITENEVSPVPTCIAVAASTPGATNTTYGTPSTPPFPASTSIPRPRPIPARYRRGERKLETADPNQTRRYLRSQCAATARSPAPATGTAGDVLLVPTGISPPGSGR